MDDRTRQPQRKPETQLARYWGPQSLTLSRLYALGYDAWQLLPAIRGQTITGAVP